MLQRSTTCSLPENAWWPSRWRDRANSGACGIPGVTSACRLPSQTSEASANRYTREREPMSAEHIRLEEAREQKALWKKWGPYLSERQWGTVREDYSEGGDAWNYFTHDQARSRAYRWGE